MTPGFILRDAATRIRRYAPHLSEKDALDKARAHLHHLTGSTQPVEHRERLEAAALAAYLALEDTLPQPAALRHRFLRVASAILDTLEEGGADSSAVLAGTLEVTSAEEQLIRGWRNLYYELSVEGSFLEPGADLPSHQVEHLLSPDSYLLHDPDGSVRALWDQGDAAWLESYQRCIPPLLSSILRPAGLAPSQWEELLYTSESVLRETQERLLSRLDPADLAQARIRPLPDGSFEGVPH